MKPRLQLLFIFHYFYHCLYLWFVLPFLLSPRGSSLFLRRMKTCCCWDPLLMSICPSSWPTIWSSLRCDRVELLLSWLTLRYSSIDASACKFRSIIWNRNEGNWSLFKSFGILSIWVSCFFFIPVGCCSYVCLTVPLFNRKISFSPNVRLHLRASPLTSSRGSSSQNETTASCSRLSRKTVTAWIFKSPNSLLRKSCRSLRWW